MNNTGTRGNPLYLLRDGLSDWTSAHMSTVRGDPWRRMGIEEKEKKKGEEGNERGESGE